MLVYRRVYIYISVIINQKTGTFQVLWLSRPDKPRVAGFSGALFEKNGGRWDDSLDYMGEYGI